MSDQTGDTPSASGGGGSGSRKRPHDDVTSDDVTSDDVTANDVTANDVTQEEVGDEDEEDLVHLDDLFSDQEEALYGSSTDTECTYSRGYLPRQPVYACRTCRTDGPAAICYGCAKRCHDGHDLLELYSKRNLCCDCGNAKFAGVVDPASGEKFACQLCEFKTLNRDNEYNQNFDGLYCVCSRPYPDPENDPGGAPGEEMLQCAVCEDWYHASHLAAPDWCGGGGRLSASPDTYDELVCQLCSARLPYLRHYALAGPSTSHGIDGSSDAPRKPSDVAKELSDTSVKPSDTSVKPSDTSVKPSDTSVKPSDTSVKPSDTSVKPSDIASGTTDTQPEPSGASATGPSDTRCVLRDRPQSSPPAGDVAAALLMPSGWRRRLCRCPTCLTAYARDRVACLTDPADSLVEFELTNRRAAEEQSRPENVLRSLASAGVPHVSVQMVASAIGDFRRGLTRAMASVLADKNCGEGQPAVITREDADRILAMMAPLLTKRARFQPPDNCRKD